MPRKTLLLWLSAPLILALCWSPTASAQDEFDDEFEDFETTPAPTPRPSPPPPSPAAGGDEFGDLEDDVEATPPSRAPAPAPARDDDEDDALDDEPPPAREPRDEDALAAERRARRHVLHNTWGGSVGGFRVLDAGSGAAGAFRAQIGFNFFGVSDWLEPGDSHTQVGGSLSLSWNPVEYLEFYGAIASYANSNPMEDPNLFQVLGDNILGIKANYPVLPWLRIGGDVGVGFLNTVGDIGLFGESTSVGIRANVSADLRELEGQEGQIPVIARLNLQYWFDNSSALINDVEQRRYDALPTTGPDARRSFMDEDRHLITRIERYALRIDRTDRFTIGVGFEFPFEIRGDGWLMNLSPIAEWNVHIPVNRQGYSCLFIPGVGTPDEPAAGLDGCLDRQGFDAFRQTLTLGVRWVPMEPLRGLNVFAAIDIGLTGTYTPVRELAAQEPYNVMFGFGYAYDTQPRIEEVVREVERTVEVPAEIPPRGRVLGTIVEEGEGTPIAGAVVAFPGRELTALSASADGTFRTYELDPGEVEMSLSHPEYHEGTCSATLPEEGGDVEVQCELAALPRVGTLRGRVVGDDGATVGGATIALSGPATRTITTSPDGTFNADDLPPGEYEARVEAENYLIKLESFGVRAREEARPEITLVARPARSLVTLRQRDINIRRQVNFATNSADILPNSSQLLSEIADVVLRHPELRRIEIQGHTDNRGGAAHNQDLSQRRAEAVRTWLINAGVSAERLVARGFGQERPLVPNITAANRARNRRVQFIIEERAD